MCFWSGHAGHTTLILREEGAGGVTKELAMIAFGAYLPHDSAVTARLFFLQTTLSEVLPAGGFFRHRWRIGSFYVTTGHEYDLRSHLSTSSGSRGLY